MDAVVYDVANAEYIFGRDDTVGTKDERFTTSRPEELMHLHHQAPGATRIVHVIYLNYFRKWLSVLLFLPALD